MQVQLALVLLMFSLTAVAVSDKEMNDLFKNYELVMNGKHPELMEKVFTESFLQGNGGKKGFQDKITELNKVSKNDSYKTLEITWKKGVKGTVYFVNVKKIDSYKSKETHNLGSRFIVVEEKNGELKIKGTLSDAD